MPYSHVIHSFPAVAPVAEFKAFWPFHVAHPLHYGCSVVMRIQITVRPPRTYDPKGKLLVGRVYDLPSELAAALVLEGCAELEDVREAAAVTVQPTMHGRRTPGDKH